MRRFLMLVAAVALAALVFAPAAIAQDDNPSGDDLRGDDHGGQRGFDDNPSADDVMSSPTATASASPTAGASSTSSPTPTASATAEDTASTASALPDTGGAPVGSLLGVAAGVLLVGGGIVAAKLMRRIP